MALMFSRVAHNFIKNGYFPTDGPTLESIQSALQVGSKNAVRIIDPCCGEGVALAEIGHSLSQNETRVEALGVEYDKERSEQAKTLLDKVIHADISDVFVTAKSCGLLFLNPPYGDMPSGAEKRFEMFFLKRTLAMLQLGGVLVLIVPRYVVDEEVAALLARNFTCLRGFISRESRFKQCVIFGVRRKSGHATVDVVKALTSLQSEGVQLPVSWLDEPYVVPPIDSDPEFRFCATKVDPAQLTQEIARFRAFTNWPQFQALFENARHPDRAPLMALSQWHLALALAAGQITGTVRSRTGRILLIKGNTFKEKVTKVEFVVNEEGQSSETRTCTDRFVPIIRGIDMTPGSDLGTIVTIR